MTFYEVWSLFLDVLKYTFLILSLVTLLSSQLSLSNNLKEENKRLTLYSINLALIGIFFHLLSM